MDPQEFFKESASRNIALVMDLIDGVLGRDDRKPFIRKSILRRINDIKRDGLTALASERERVTPICTSVAGVAHFTLSKENHHA